MATTEPREPDWWRRLKEKERQVFRRIMGESWRPTGTLEEETERAFRKSRERMRDIDRRLAKKLRGDDDA